jgi:hypothetical protein
MAQPVSADVATAARTGQDLLYYSTSSSSVDVPLPLGPSGAGWIPSYSGDRWITGSTTPTRVVVGSLGIAASTALAVRIFDVGHAALNPLNVTVIQTPAAVEGNNASAFPCPVAVAHLGADAAVVSNRTCIASTLITWRGSVINLPADKFSVSFEATLLLVPGGFIFAGLTARHRYANGASGLLQMPVGLQGVVVSSTFTTAASDAARPLGSIATGASGVVVSDAEEPGVATAQSYTGTFALLDEPVSAQWAATGTVAVLAPTAACIACTNGLCNAETGVCICAVGADPATGCASCLDGYISAARPVRGGVACVRCPCRNGGVCRPTQNAVFTPMTLAQRCMCPAGYDGALCEYSCSAAVAPRAAAHPPALMAAWRGALTGVLVVQRILLSVAATDIGGALIRVVCTSAADATGSPITCGGIDVLRAADASATRTTSYRANLEAALVASPTATCACGRCYYVGPEAASEVMFPNRSDDIAPVGTWVGIALLIALGPSLAVVVVVCCFRRCVAWSDVQRRAMAQVNETRIQPSSALPPAPIVTASPTLPAVRMPPPPPPPIAAAPVKPPRQPQPPSARQAVVDLLTAPHSYDFTSVSTIS